MCGWCSGSASNGCGVPRNTEHVIWETDAATATELIIPADKQLRFLCTHCGVRFALPLPVSITMAAAVAKVFTREHARCRKPKDAP